MAETEVKKFYDVDSKAIRFRNFAGKAGQYNAEGDRNFCLLLKGIVNLIRLKKY